MTNDADAGEEAGPVDLLNLSDGDALILWTHGGYGTRQDFPGARIATLRMLRGNDAGGRQGLARLFASLAPHHAVRLVLAVLLLLANRPAPIRLPAPTPLELVAQGRFYRTTPARAP